MYSSVNPSFEYHPAKSYPSLVGSVGLSTVAPYSFVWEATADHQFELNVIS